MKSSSRIYNLEKGEWKFEIRNKGKHKPMERRDHLAFYYRNEFYVMGGHNGSYTDHIKDYYSLDPNLLLWKKGQKNHHIFCKNILTLLGKASQVLK